MSDELRRIATPPPKRPQIAKIMLIVAASLIGLFVLAGVIVVVGAAGY